MKFAMFLAIAGYINYRLWFFANHLIEYSWLQFGLDIVFMIVLVSYGRRLNASKPQNRD